MINLSCVTKSKMSNGMWKNIVIKINCRDTLKDVDPLSITSVVPPKTEQWQNKSDWNSYVFCEIFGNI